MCIFSHCSFVDYYYEAKILIFLYTCVIRLPYKGCHLFHGNNHIVILRILNILLHFLQIKNTDMVLLI